MAQQNDGPQNDVRAAEAKVRRAILGLLVYEGPQRPWSMGELAAEIDGSQAVEDGVRQLQGVGLVHRCGDFVWASRAAFAAEELLR